MTVDHALPGWIPIGHVVAYNLKFFACHLLSLRMRESAKNPWVGATRLEGPRQLDEIW